MNVRTRLATYKDYYKLCDLFNATNAEYQRMLPDFYRVVGKVLPPKWKFNAMVAAKKAGLLSGISMIVAENDAGRVVGAVYCESIERPKRSWQAREYVANIETLCVPPSTVLDKVGRVRVKEALVGAVINWAKETGHGYVAVRDHIAHAENAEVYAAFGLKPDYVTYGRPTVV